MIEAYFLPERVPKLFHRELLAAESLRLPLHGGERPESAHDRELVESESVKAVRRVERHRVLAIKQRTQLQSLKLFS